MKPEPVQMVNKDVHTRMAEKNKSNMHEHIQIKEEERSKNMKSLYNVLFFE